MKYDDLKQNVVIRKTFISINVFFFILYQTCNNKYYQYFLLGFTFKLFLYFKNDFQED